MCRLCENSGSLTLLEPSGTLQACVGIVLPLLLHNVDKFQSLKLSSLLYLILSEVSIHNRKSERERTFCSVLFYFILFPSILSYTIILCAVQLYCILFCLVILCWVTFCSILWYYILFCSILFCSSLFYSIPFYSYFLYCSIPYELFFKFLVLFCVALHIELV